MKSSPFQSPVAAGRWPRCVPSASAALALAVVLAGCSTLQPSDAQLPPVAVPAGWSATGAGGVATPLVQWWERLGAPELTALISEARAANTSVRSAQAALQQSRALVDVQMAGTLPRLGASGSAQRSRASGSTGNSFSAGFDASWEPDVFGRLRAGVNASEADARVAQASLADVQVSLAAEVAVNYIELRGLQQRLQIARSNLASQQETLKLSTSWRSLTSLLVGNRTGRLQICNLRTTPRSLHRSVRSFAADVGFLDPVKPGQFIADHEDALAILRLHDVSRLHRHHTANFVFHGHLAVFEDVHGGTILQGDRLFDRAHVNGKCGGSGGEDECSDCEFFEHHFS